MRAGPDESRHWVTCVDAAQAATWSRVGGGRRGGTGGRKTDAGRGGTEGEREEVGKRLVCLVPAAAVIALAKPTPCGMDLRVGEPWPA